MKYLYAAGLLVLTVATAPVQATTITIVNLDAGTGEGFDDPAEADPVAGNPGTTIGQQRLNVFEAAARFWESYLDSDVEIKVDASFASLACQQNQGVLGSAGPLSYSRDFVNAPLPSTWYSIALANSYRGEDLEPGASDIVATFNREVNGNPNCLGGANWSYQIGVMPISNGIDLLSTVIHELGHGLNWLSLVDPDSGQLGIDTGFTDVYTDRLFDTETMKSWPAMTDMERLDSSVNTGDLVWNGPLATAEAALLNTGLNDGYPQMFAPAQNQSGSSVSHWDTELAPDDIMEPFLTAVQEPYLTIKGMYDMGWQGTACLRMELPTGVWRMISLDCLPPSGVNTLELLLGDDIGGSAGSSYAAFQYLPESGSYQALGDTDPLELDSAYWIIQGTGNTVTLEIPRASTRTPTPTGYGEDSNCQSQLNCRSISLAVNASTTQTWQMLGNPFNTAILFDEVRITADSGSCSDLDGCSPDEAQTADVMAGTVWSWQDGNYVAHTIPSNTQLPINAGLWSLVLAGAGGINPVIHWPKHPYAGRIE